MYEGPGTYRHYKGAMYSVHGLGVAEATLTPVVIYSPADGRRLPQDVKARFPDEVASEIRCWTRTLTSFNDMVGDVPRFEKVEDIGRLGKSLLSYGDSFPGAE